MYPEPTPSDQAPARTYRPARSSKAPLYLMLLLLCISVGTATVVWMQHQAVKDLLARRAAALARRGPAVALNRALGYPGLAIAPSNARGNRLGPVNITRILARLTDLTPDQTTKLTDLYNQRRQAVNARADTTDLDSQISALVGPDDFAVIQPMLNGNGRRRGRGGAGGG
jgi:hypothetical protein